MRSEERVQTCSQFRPGDPNDPEQAVKLALRLLGVRHQTLSRQIEELDTLIRGLCAAINPALLGAHGVGPEIAATLLVAAGGNPERMHHERAFAAMCGTSPIEASSGQTTRHRLNRGGNRQANNALWTIAMVRMSKDQRTRDYIKKKTSEGKNKKEAIRCLKRHIAREIHHLLTKEHAVISGQSLRNARKLRGLTLSEAGETLKVSSLISASLESPDAHLG